MVRTPSSDAQAVLKIGPAFVLSAARARSMEFSTVALFVFSIRTNCRYARSPKTILNRISTPFFVPASKPFLMSSKKAIMSELISSDPNSRTVLAFILNTTLRHADYNFLALMSLIESRAVSYCIGRKHVSQRSSISSTSRDRYPFASTPILSSRLLSSASVT